MRLLALLLFLPSVALAEPAAVVRVLDGDTADMAIAGLVQRVRVHGIDSPETGSRALCAQERQLGEAAKRAAMELLPVGSEVDLQRAPGKDRYGRLLARIILRDGRDFGQVMLAQGLAVYYNGRGPKKEWCR